MSAALRHVPIGMAALALLAASLLLWSCGNPPTSAVEQRGSIEVQGFLLPGNMPADSIRITLDEDSLGYFPNMYTLEGIIAGTHRLDIATRAIYGVDTLDYYSAPQEVEVAANQKAVAEFALSTDIPESPYEGYMAPDFELYDLDSSIVSLSELEGQVVLLYFFTTG